MLEHLVVQDLCPQNLTGHFNMPYDNFTLSLIRQTLDPDHYGLAPCVPVALGTGIPEVIETALVPEDPVGVDRAREGRPLGGGSRGVGSQHGRERSVSRAPLLARSRTGQMRPVGC